jgi:predicted metal-dependent hydrolase
VTVDPDRGVEVVLPRRSPERQAERVVRELGPWIERRLAAQERARAAVQGPPGTVPYLGEALTLVPEPGRMRVHRRGDDLLVPAEDPGPALERWYRRAARAEIAPRAEAAAAAVGGRVTGLTIRAQRTRWGSCSPTGALSFNWRLLLAPEPVLDYVVIHEACHLKVADHSQRFWALVGRHCPDWRAQARWLRRNGSALTLAL